MAICVAIYKNEGAKGKAKAAVASAASTHVRREFIPHAFCRKVAKKLKAVSEIPIAGGTSQLQAVFIFCLQWRR